MYMYDERMRQIFYRCANNQRKQEFVDSRMITEDPRAMSNLPTQGFQKMYNLNGVLSKSPFRDYEVGP